MIAIWHLTHWKSSHVIGNLDIVTFKTFYFTSSKGGHLGCWEPAELDSNILNVSV